MIRIVTDSAADITQAQAREMGVEIVPLNIFFPGVQYDQQADTDFSTFYAMLESEKVFPKTSQPPPEAFAAIFAQAKEAGDGVIAILISSGLSGTVQSAKIAKDTAGHADVHIIDSQTAIMAQRILVEQAVALRDAGESLDTIVSKVNALCGRVKVFGMLDTLTYLYKGGRLSKTVAIAGNLLHIKPLVTLKNGVIALCGRGRNCLALGKLLTEIGFDDAYPVYFGYTPSMDNCKKLQDYAMEHYAIGHTGVFPVGGLIGAHIGHGATAMAFVAKA